MLLILGEHSSGDDVSIEVITNTSSDIEIISSPVLSENGRRVQEQNQQLLQSRMVNASPRKDHPRHHVKKGMKLVFKYVFFVLLLVKNGYGLWTGLNWFGTQFFGLDQK